MWTELGKRLTNNIFKLVSRVFSDLKFIRDRLPPKIHAACVSLFFNGFHTARRYQRNTPCVFCKKKGTVDSIEHITECNMVLGCIPNRYLEEDPNRINRLFFFMTNNNNLTLSFAMFCYAVYSVHNQVRHIGITREFRQQIGRALHDRCSEGMNGPCGMNSRVRLIIPS